MPLGGATEAQK